MFFLILYKQYCIIVAASLAFVFIFFFYVCIHIFIYNIYIYIYIIVLSVHLSINIFLLHLNLRFNFFVFSYFPFYFFPPFQYTLYTQVEPINSINNSMSNYTRKWLLYNDEREKDFLFQHGIWVVYLFFFSNRCICCFRKLFIFFIVACFPLSFFFTASSCVYKCMRLSFSLI